MWLDPEVTPGSYTCVCWLCAQLFASPERLSSPGASRVGLRLPAVSEPTSVLGWKRGGASLGQDWPKVGPLDYPQRWVLLEAG